MQRYLIPMNHFALIAVTGKDAATFLQGQLTCDMREITESHGLLGACCDHKGRMVANFFVFRKNDDYFLLLPKSMIELTITHLKKYAVFSKVALTPADYAKYSHSEINATSMDENTWRASNIKMGFVWIYPETSGALIPQMINLQKWDGVSFTKGCYIGQEIVARTEHLGKLKRHLYQVQVECENTPKPGDELKNQNDQVVGIVVEAASKKNKKQELLAVIQDSALENSIIFKQSPISIVASSK